MFPETIAVHNFRNLEANPFHGNGFVQGRAQTERGHLVQIYWMMDQAGGNRNRALRDDGEGCVSIMSLGEMEEQNHPSFSLHEVMREFDNGKVHVVGNGPQVSKKLLVEYSDTHGDLNAMLREFTYWPDAPHFTQRMTGMIDMNVGMHPFSFLCLRRSQFNDSCDRSPHQCGDIPMGFARGVRAYLEQASDGTPLSSMRSEPSILPIYGSTPAEIARSYWDILPPDKRLAVVAKLIDPHDCTSSIHIING